MTTAADRPVGRRSPVRVAVIQFDPQVGLENLESNAAAVRKRLDQAVKERANLIVLPELASTG
jgi:N-carbamoylputrescine amidase